MTQVEHRGYTFVLPPRGRFGSQILYTLDRIMDSENGIALYAAMNLEGRARQYEDRYKRAFVRFARENPCLLKEGYPGPKGGYGFLFIGKKVIGE